MTAILVSKFKLISLVVIVLTLITFFSYNNLTIEDNESKVKILDLSKPLVPEFVYENVSCIKSAKFIVETTLCVNDYRIDYVSQIIWSHRVFEHSILGKSHLPYL